MASATSTVISTSVTLTPLTPLPTSTRLALLRHHLLPPVPSSPKGVLIIPGPDSRHGYPNEIFVKYLLLNATGKALLSPSLFPPQTHLQTTVTTTTLPNSPSSPTVKSSSSPISAVTVDALDECILLLTRSGLHIFCEDCCRQLITSILSGGLSETVTTRTIKSANGTITSITQSITPPPSSLPPSYPCAGGPSAGYVTITSLPPSSSFGSDNDAAYEAKCRAFRSLLSCAFPHNDGASEAHLTDGIAVLLPAGYDGDVEEVERWPLVRSLAAGEVGEEGDLSGRDRGAADVYRPSIFGVRFPNVTNASPLLYDLLLLSPPSTLTLSHALSNVLLQLAPQVASSLSVIPRTTGAPDSAVSRNVSRRRSISEQDVGEAVDLYYEFGLSPLSNAAVAEYDEAKGGSGSPLRDDTGGREDTTLPFRARRGANCYFGERSRLVNEPAGPGAEPEYDAELLSSPESCLDAGVVHFVISCEEPSSGTRCCRTYFTATGGRVPLGKVAVAGEDAPKVASPSRSPGSNVVDDDDDEVFEYPNPFEDERAAPAIVKQSAASVSSPSSSSSSSSSSRQRADHIRTKEEAKLDSFTKVYSALVDAHSLMIFDLCEKFGTRDSGGKTHTLSDILTQADKALRLHFDMSVCPPSVQSSMKFFVALDAVDAFANSIPSGLRRLRVGDYFLYVRSSVFNLTPDEESSTLAVGDTVDLASGCNLTRGAAPYFRAFRGVDGKEGERCAELMLRLADQHETKSTLGLGRTLEEISNVHVLFERKVSGALSKQAVRRIPVEARSIRVTSSLKLYEWGFIVFGEGMVPLVVTFKGGVFCAKVVDGSLYNVNDEEALEGRAGAEDGSLVARRGAAQPPSLLLVSVCGNASEGTAVANVLPSGWCPSSYEGREGSGADVIAIVLPKGSRQFDAVTRQLPEWREVGAKEGVCVPVGRRVVTPEGKPAIVKTEKNVDWNYEITEEQDRGCQVLEDSATPFVHIATVSADIEAAILVAKNSTTSGGGSSQGSVIKLPTSCARVLEERRLIDAENASALIGSDFVEESQEAVEKHTPISLLIGIPGAPVLEAAEQILMLSKDEFVWLHVHQHLLSVNELNVKSIEDACAAQQRVDGKGKRTRVLLSVIGFVDVRKVVRTLQTRGRGANHIACVTTIVGAGTVAVKETQWMPLLIDQCCGEFVQNVLVYEDSIFGKGRQASAIAAAPSVASKKGGAPSVAVFSRPAPCNLSAFLSSVRSGSFPPALLKTSRTAFNMHILADVVRLGAFSTRERIRIRRGVVVDMSDAPEVPRLARYKRMFGDSALTESGITCRNFALRLDPSQSSCEIDVERLGIVLKKLLGGVSFRSMSAVMTKGGEGKGVGGWLKKAAKTEKAGEERSHWRRLLELARFKVESSMLREVSLDKLQRDLDGWLVRWSQITGSECQIIGVGGSLDASGKSVAVEGMYKVEGSLHFSFGGGGEGLFVYGMHLRDAHFTMIDEVLRMCFYKKKPDLKVLIARSDVNRETIASKYVDLPLPVDWQFDGKNYVNFMGEKKLLRPDIEDVIDLEVETVNRKLTSFNEAVQANDDDMLGVLSTFKTIKW